MDIAYVTDAEGQWEKLVSFCANNPLVSLAGDRLTLAEGARFVFGGDAIDRGPHARRIVACLTDAKLRYAERVVLLAGNRDLNKLRLARELGGHLPERAPQSLRDASPAALLRWIFAETMGAPDAFEHRRTELGSAGEPGHAGPPGAASGRAVSDEEVLHSYLDDVAPSGALTNYLELCALAYRHGATLFVHGGLGEASLGEVPAHGSSESVDDLDEWVMRLNAWYKRQLVAYRAGALEPSGEPAWQPLINYQQPLPGQRINPGSVVYGRLADEHNNPRLPPLPVVQRLCSAGIRRLVVGHMPSGDTPSVLRDPSRDFELILADNSYGRVSGASRVLLNDEVVLIEGDTVLDDTRRCAVRFTLVAGERSSLLGLQVGHHGPLIKAPLVGDQYLTFKVLPRYQVQQRAEPAAVLRAQALSVPYP